MSFSESEPKKRVSLSVTDLFESSLVSSIVFTAHPPKTYSYLKNHYRYGFQSWVGGECVYLILLSWDPRFGDHIPNTFSADTGMTTAQFVSYVIFSIISLPFLWIKPHRLQPFFTFASVVTIVFFTVLLIWALATMGPSGFGDTISNGETLPSTGGPQSAAWLMVYGIMSTIGSIAAGILNQNDFARLARRPSDAILGQAFAYPVYGTFASVIGILVVAATQQRLGGEAVWNPPTLFVRLLERDESAGTRASVFFAGLALVISQLGSSIPGNAIAGGIDLASVFPKYVNIRRGAYITAILSPIVNPWRLVNTATIFLSVLSSYGVFLAPMTGMMTAHYVLVTKSKMKIEDLYRGDKSSIYWYYGGINWRAPVTVCCISRLAYPLWPPPSPPTLTLIRIVWQWIIGCAPCIPGFAAAVNTTLKVSDGAVELYYMNYLYGYCQVLSYTMCCTWCSLCRV